MTWIDERVEKLAADANRKEKRSRSCSPRPTAITFPVEVSFAPLAPKGDLGIPLHIKEIGAAKVGIPLRHSGVHARRVDLDPRE